MKITGHRKLIRIRWVTIVLLLALVGLQTPHEAQAQTIKAQPQKQKVESPRAMVIVHSGYQRERKLAEAHTHEAVELAFELARASYIVELITDKSSHAAVKEYEQKLVKNGKQMPKNFQLNLAEADRSEEVEKKISEWLKLVGQEKSPLAILVVSGHGVEHDKTPVFQAAGDADDDEGLAISTIMNQAAEQENGLPLVIVWNTCRPKLTPADKPNPLVIKDKNGKVIEPAKPKEPSNSTDWLTKRRSGFFIRPVDPTERKMRNTPAVLYATASGAVAKAAVLGKQTVIGHLAAALREKARFDDFLRLLYPNRLQQSTIRLQEWAHYGVSHFQSDFLTQTPELVEGDLVTLDTVIATRTPGNDGGLEGPKNPQQRINLLQDILTKSFGDLDLKHELTPTPGSLTVSYNGQPTTAPWAGARVGGETGVSPVGRYLELEFVAEKGKNTPANAQGLKFYFNPTYTLPDEPGFSYNLAIGRRSFPNDPANTPIFTAFFGRPSKVYLPLIAAPDKANKIVPLDTIGFATGSNLMLEPWPADATVRVTHLQVVSRSLLPVGARLSLETQPANLDLYPGRWTGGDQSPLEKSIRFEKNGKGIRLIPEAKEQALGRTGGRLTPALYAPDGYLLRFELGNMEDKEAELFVDLLREDGQRGIEEQFIDRKSVKIPGNARSLTRDVPLKGSGWVNYLSLSTQSKGITINSITLVRGPNAK